MVLIDGKKIAKKIMDELKAKVARLTFRPLLVDVLVGDNPVSLSYIQVKAQAARNIGCDFQLVQIPQYADQIQVQNTIQNIDFKNLKGLIVQLPLPAHLEKKTIANLIPQGLDIDCISEANLLGFYSHIPKFIPPTAAAIVHILDSLPISLTEKNIAIIGKGDLVGKPTAQLLAERGIKVNIADKTTESLKDFLLQADIIISGTGQPNLITGDLLKTGCVVIDAGTAESAGSIVGDVDKLSVELKASYLSPVPGGVGPVTVAMLYKNLLIASWEKTGD